MARAAVPALVLAAVAGGCVGPLGGGSTRSSTTVRMEMPTPSSAMEPTYRCAKPAPGCSADRADVLVVNRTRRIAKGDVIAYQVTERGRVQCGAGGLFVHRVQSVEAGGAGFFVVGDNRSQSCDSRVFGSVPAKNVIGEVVGVRR